MEKTFKLNSKFLTAINDVMQKLALNDSVTIIKNPIMEADGNFTSVISTKDNFDPTKVSSNVLVQAEDEKNKDLVDEKNKLVSQATDKIKKSLEVGDELQSILNQIKKLNQEDGYNEWKLNEKGNTAELKGKNAKIFKQNNNLCLSYNDKVEIFKSVAELHQWLKDNNFPLPKNIQIHESLQEDASPFLQNSPWDKILKQKTTNSGMKIGDTTEITDEEREELEKSRTKPIYKMGQAEYKDAMKWLDKKDKPQRNIPGLPKEEATPEQLELSNLWYLVYEDANKSETLYLNSDWNENNLLTNNLQQAAVFPSRENALVELDNIYSLHQTDAPFKPVQETELSECFGGGATTVGALGSATQYLGNKKTKTESDDLKEVIYGYKGTPFENTTYTNKYYRGSEYLNWANAINDKGQRNVDPNYDQNILTAHEDRKSLIASDRGGKHWAGVDLNRGETDTMFYGMLNKTTGKPLDKDQFIAKVREINDKYGLDINPNEDVVSRKIKPGMPTHDEEGNPIEYSSISPHNKAQRKKWVNDWWIPNRYDTIKGHKASAEVRASDYQNELNMPSADERLASDPKLNAEYKRLFDIHDQFDPSEAIKFFNELQKAKTKLEPESFNILVDKLIQDSEEGNIDASPVITSFWKTLKTDPKTESNFKEEFIKKLKAKTETTLKEDDTPADFASNISSDMSAAATDTATSSPEDSTATDTTPDIDMSADSGMDNPTAEFGDINVGGGGGYGPEDSEEPMPIPEGPEYKIVDVLVNDKDESDIRVKVQNLDTGEIETRELSEIDV